MTGTVLCNGANGCSQPPIVADALGNYHFYAKPLVTEQIYSPQIQNPFVMTDQGLIAVAPFAGPNPWIDPTSSTYGAKCDGVTDDSVALQAAFNAIPITGGAIFIPAGKCMFGTSITIPTGPLTAALTNGYGGIQVIGLGPNVSALSYTAASGNALNAAVASGSLGAQLGFYNIDISDDNVNFNGNLVFAQNIDRVVVSNVWSECLNDTTATNQCDWHIKGNVGVGLTFGAVFDRYHFTGTSIVFDNYSDSQVVNGQIYPEAGNAGRQYAIKFIGAATGDIQVGQSHIGTVDGNTGAALWINGISPLAMRFENNFFDTDATGGPHNGTAILADTLGVDLHVTGNYFHKVPGLSINLSAGANNSLISGNTFECVGEGSALAGGFNTITIGATSTGNQIIGNNFACADTLTTKNWAIIELGNNNTGVYGPNVVAGVNQSYQTNINSFGTGDGVALGFWQGFNPFISSGFGTSPAITQATLESFALNVGTGGTATNGVIGFPNAPNGWNITCTDISTNSATVFLTKQTANSQTTATIGNFNTSATAAAWVASDILLCIPVPR